MWVRRSTTMRPHTRLRACESMSVHCMYVCVDVDECMLCACDVCECVCVYKYRECVYVGVNVYLPRMNIQGGYVHAIQSTEYVMSVHSTEYGYVCMYSVYGRTAHVSGYMQSDRRCDAEQRTR